MRALTIKALLNFKGFNDSDLFAFGATVVMRMTGNENFPTSGSVVTALAAAQDDFASALKKSSKGSEADKEDKNAQKAILITALTNVVTLVNYYAYNQADLIATTGFDYTKPSAAPMPLTLPVVDINYISGGKFCIKLKARKKYQGVVYQYALADGTVNPLTGEPLWVTTPCSDLLCIISNLPIGQKVLIRVGVWSAKEPVQYTEPLSRMVA